MTRVQGRARAAKRRFILHVGVFLLVNVALMIVTVTFGGEVWWQAFALIWGFGVAAEGALAYIWSRSGSEGRGLAHWLWKGVAGKTRSGASTTTHRSGSPDSSTKPGFSLDPADSSKENRVSAKLKPPSPP